MPDKNLCVLSDGTGTFFFFSFLLFGRGFYTTYTKVGNSPKALRRAAGGFCRIVGPGPGKSTCPLTCVDDQ
jgi:hypothetical protein